MKATGRRVRDQFRRWRLRAQRTQLRFSGEATVSLFMYHGVASDANRNWGPWRYSVTPAEFAADLSRIADRHTVVTMDDVLAVIEGERPTLPQHAAVVTFDDGYGDTLTEALPVLERHDVPATVYVSTGLIDSQGPFVFRLANALGETDPTTIDVPELEGLPDGLPPTPEPAYEKLRGPAKWESTGYRERILDAVGADADHGIPMLSAEQVSRLAGHELVTVGAHGHDHVPLTTLEPAALTENIERSATRLADIIGESPVHFSYPYGANDGTVREVVAEAGFETAVETGPAVARVGDLDAERYRIPRIDAAVYGV